MSRIGRGTRNHNPHRGHGLAVRDCGEPLVLRFALPGNALQQKPDLCEQFPCLSLPFGELAHLRERRYRCGRSVSTY